MVGRQTAVRGGGGQRGVEKTGVSDAKRGMKEQDG